ncbi:hypothetical protein [Leuconostoc mesenteroides]|uniref:hypothetical protein n=1 Tax=Leuconostoc mesenteroides TaxID=1245 RepID=UPI000B9D5ACA|nr:hypothetical protein [Leuconostoc mesenteroides]BAX73059.1 hypothetical protein LEMES_01616 [Leuconostoc mesenteroides]
MQYKTLYKCLISLLVLLQVNFFDLITFPDWFFYNINSYSVKYLSTFLILIACLVRLIEYKSNSSIRENGQINFSVSLLLLLLFGTFITYQSSIVYKQTILTSFAISYYYLFVLGYFAFHNFFTRLENIKWFFDLIIYSSVFLSITKIIQSYLAGNFGKIFFGSYSTVDKNNLMTLSSDIVGFVRLPSASDFVFFASMLLVVTFLVKKISIKNKFTILFINIFFLFIVSQTRTYVLIILVLIFGVVLIKVSSEFKRFSIVVLLFGVIGGVFFSLYLVEQMGFITTGDRSASYTVRLDAIRYYLSQFSNNGVFAIGFAHDPEFLLLNHGYSLTYGRSIYYMDDIGIIGFLAVFGKLGIAWIIIFLSELLKQILYAGNRKIVMLLCFTVLATSGTLVYLNVQRIFYLVFVLLLVDFFVHERNLEGVA